ncbi:MAG: hypothetical protein OXT70_03600 [Chloroflexota bacterium]|nr:hypothetical protein [Chloroflexota bacterium]
MLEPLVSNRLLASIILIAALVAAALFSRSRNNLLRSAGALVGSLAQPKILVPLFIYASVVLAALIPASRLGLWQPSLWPATVLWLIISGLGLLFRLDEAIRDPEFFRRALLRTIGAMALVEFIVNLESFALYLEIPLQIFAILSAAIVAMEKGASAQPASKVANTYLVLLALAAIAWGIRHLVDDWPQLDHGLLLREFLLPIWLTPIALSFVYLLSVWAAYEMAFTRMRFVNDGSLFGQRLALVLRSGVRLRNLQRLRGDGAQQLGRTAGFRDAWREWRQIQHDRLREIEAENAAHRRLVENTGLRGVDETGKQLDQREHMETRESLYWLAICHMGHYRNGQAYRDDLLPIVEPSFAQNGLSEPFGVSMRVAADGQSWYAERRTITGHWFAIGAAGPPSDQWLYDGEEAAPGFPNNETWDQWGGGRHSRNWD